MKLESVLEGLLFVVGEDGLTLEQLENILEISIEDIKKLIGILINKYEQDDRGIRINFLGNSFKLTTKEEHKKYYEKLIQDPKNNQLSQSAIETLAIIAYNQPITRIDIDEIRGVSTQQLVRKLVAKGLIKEAGKSTQLGRPILYKTTSEFLDYFNLSSLEDLPEVSFASKEMDIEEKDLYTSKYKETL